MKGYELPGVPEDFSVIMFVNNHLVSLPASLTLTNIVNCFNIFYNLTDLQGTWSLFLRVREEHLKRILEQVPRS